MSLHDLRDNAGPIFGMIIVCGIIGTLISIGVAEELHRGKFQHEATQAGHAEFYLDKDNIRQWRWLPPCTRNKN